MLSIRRVCASVVQIRPGMRMFSAAKMEEDIFSQTLAEDPPTDAEFKAAEAEATRRKRREEKSSEEAAAREKSDTVRVVRRNIRVSPKRYQALLRMVSGLNYREACMQLKFNTQKGASIALQLVEYGRKEAVEKFKLNPDRLIVSEIFATKGKIEKRLDRKAKGRAGLRQLRYSHLTVVLKEKKWVEGERFLGKFTRGRVKAKDSALTALPLPSESALQ